MDELLDFFSVHRSVAPGLLWPQHQHPAYRPHASRADHALLSEALIVRTGLLCRIWQEQAPSCGVRAGRTRSHLLVHQTTHAADWALSGPGGTFRCRLVSMDILYIPPRHAWHARLGSQALLTFTTLGPDTRSQDP